MAGLLGDSFDDPKTMAVMQMAAGLLGGGNFGQALGRGLGGYQQTMSAAKEQALLDEQMQWKRDERKRVEDQRKQESEIERLIQAQFMPTTGVQAIQGDALGPTVAKAQNIGQMPQPNYQQLAAMGVPMDRLKALAEAPNLGRSEVARTMEVEGPNGSKMIVQLDKWGKPVAEGMPGYMAPVQVNQGDKITFAKPQAGQTFNVGMSPAEQQRVAQGLASNNLARERFNFDKSQADGGGEFGASQAALIKQFGKPSPGYRWKPDGSQEFIPGGPADQKAQLQKSGEGTVGAVVADLRDKYNVLDENNGIVSTNNRFGTNIGARISSTGLGQALGGAVGTTNQSARDSIAMTRPLLLQAIMKATGMSAKQMDSNAELKLYLATATDPTLGLEANKQALDRIEQLYGGGASGASGGNSGVVPLPANPTAKTLVPGTVYDTPRGKARWDGMRFTEVN